MALPPDDAAAIALRGVAALLASLGEAHASGAPWAAHSSVPRLRLTVHSALVPGVAARAFRGTCLLPYPVAVVYALLGDLRARERWDRNIVRLDTRAVAGGATVFYSVTKPVGPISGRDFVDATWRGELSALPAEVRTGAGAAALAAGALVNGGAGMEAGHADFPASAAMVRGLNHASGWVLEPCAPDAGTSGQAGSAWTRISYLVQPELKGWMPTSLVNATLAGMFTAFFGDLIEYVGTSEGAEAAAAAAAAATTAATS